jgi:hypothetical protein
MRLHRHPIHERCGTRGDGPARALYLHEAEAAGGDGLEAIVVAEVWHVDARAPERVEDGTPTLELARLAVQDDAKHAASSSG